MDSFVAVIVKTIGDFLERLEVLKGERTFKEVHVHQKLNENYKAITNHGSSIEIFCKEVTYRICYTSWWAIEHEIVMYHVYCHCSHDTDPAVKAKLSEEFKIAQFLHPWSHRASQKKAVIDSYMDLILHKL